MIRWSTLMLLAGCSGSGSLTLEWTLIRDDVETTCPAGAQVEVSMPVVFEVFPCEDGDATLEGLEEGQYRADFNLLGPDGTIVASFNRLVVLDGTDVVVPVVFVLP